MGEAGEPEAGSEEIADSEELPAFLADDAEAPEEPEPVEPDAADEVRLRGRRRVKSKAGRLQPPGAFRNPLHPRPALAPGFRVLRRTSMSSQPIQASFHRTAEGRLAARVADIAFLALPTKREGLRVAYASRLASPPERWTRQ